MLVQLHTSGNHSGTSHACFYPACYERRIFQFVKLYCQVTILHQIERQAFHFSVMKIIVCRGYYILLVLGTHYIIVWGWVYRHFKQLIISLGMHWSPPGISVKTTTVPNLWSKTRLHNLQDKSSFCFIYVLFILGKTADKNFIDMTNDMFNSL